MKCLRLTQPYARLVALSLKKIETRSGAPHGRGPLAIHAAKTFPVWARDLCATSPFRESLATAGVHRWQDLDVTRGCILAVCALYEVKPLPAPINLFGAIPTWVDDLSEQERAFGDDSAGRYGLFLRSVVPLNQPIPATGALGLWEYLLEAERGIEVTR